ncbi:MAG: DNA-processing protein DprA [Kistimonas sp.]|nr:DNA-processing protein DprA [Kistimonas sp.]
MDKDNDQIWQRLHPWLTLFHVTGLGPVRYRVLLAAFGSPDAVLSAGVGSLQRLLSGGLARAVAGAATNTAVQTAVAHDKRWLESSSQNTILCLVDDRYPPLLKTIADPPVVLYVKGDPRHLSSQQLAIVGSRKASTTAMEAAYRVATQISAARIIITSGLAKGVDSMAHRGALDQGGHTVAVLATGIDLVYPRAHTQLAEKICQQGALVSEFPLGTQPVPGHFPRRNRIISGLGMGVLVVEAGVASGSLITARYALDQGRDVLAMPGSVSNPGARGCHALIRDGACLVENAEQILEELTSCLARPGRTAVSLETTGVEPSCPEQRHLLECMGFEPCHNDELVLRTGMSSQQVATLLLHMEMDGLVQQTPAGVARKV